MNKFLYIFLLLSAPVFAGAEHVAAWKQLIVDVRELPTIEKVVRVNDFFNSTIVYGTDQDVWGVSDYWATPLQTLLRGKGDCEDIAIAKYVTLKKVGVNVADMRLSIVFAHDNSFAHPIREKHMVLNFYVNETTDPLVLDNKVADIFPLSQRVDLQHVVDFNDTSVWMNGVVLGRTTDTLTRWKDVTLRMQKE